MAIIPPLPDLPGLILLRVGGLYRVKATNIVVLFYFFLNARIKHKANHIFNFIVLFIMYRDN